MEGKGKARKQTGQRGDRCRIEVESRVIGKEGKMEYQWKRTAIREVDRNIWFYVLPRC